jgi:RTX calcium-binding nonapeptide repeat (4 copies)
MCSASFAQTLRRLWRLGWPAAIGVAFLVSAQEATAKVTCRLDTASHLLSVESTSSFLDEPVLRRAGDRIVVYREYLGPLVPCAGAPTVTNTDRIKLLVRNFGNVEIQLAGGPLAPGASPEPDSSPEIELTVAGTAAVFLDGGPAPERFRFMAADGESGVNLNPSPTDDDVDVSLSSAGFSELYVDGGSGADVFDVLGHPALEVAAFGGPGNDLLDSRRGEGIGGALLEGGKGNDRIFGGPGDEGIYPGRGRDVVKAGAGDDFVFARPDRVADRIDCGAGDDRMIEDTLGRHRGPVADRNDRLRSCGRPKGHSN